MKEEEATAMNTEFLQELFRDAESDPNLEIISTESSAACNAGDNFMSNVYRFTIMAKDSNNNINKRFILLKKQLSNAAWREAFGCDLAFRNEAAAYNNVIPEMNKFCHFNNLAFPRCFHASCDFTILEDLKPMGFKMADRLEGLDFAHAKLALKELGRFHGTSLAMKHSQRKIFEGLTSSIHEIVFLTEKKKELRTAVMNSLRMAVMGLKVLRATGTDCLEDIIDKLQILKNSAYETLLQLVEPREPLSVVCHGDFYINNILFKYNDSGEVCDVMVIDLQNFRYASLSLDFLYLLSTSLKPGVLFTHFGQLVEVYHASLNEQMQRYAPNSTEVSLREIYGELKAHSTYGLLMGLLLLPAITALPGSVARIDEMESFSAQDFFERSLDILSTEYFIRLHQLFIDFTQLGYL